MLFFGRKKIKTNFVELERVLLNKTESLYVRFHYDEISKKDLYGIHAVIRNVPLEIGTDGKLIAKVRYIGIPNMVVYFVLKISNIQDGYISACSTIDVIVNANIKGDKCNHARFELLKVYDKGGVLTCV